MKVAKKQNLKLLSFYFGHLRSRKFGAMTDNVNLQLRCAPAPTELVAKCCFDEVARGCIYNFRTLTNEQNIHGTYEDLFPLVCSWISSPLGLTVNILQSGTPTSL